LLFMFEASVFSSMFKASFTSSFVYSEGLGFIYSF
jgi:hypothetical protein